MIAKRSATETPRVEPDADAPLSDDEFERGYSALLARSARAATGLSQRAFSERYGIPAASLRDWEQGRRVPDSATRSYLRVIVKMPDAVAQALHDAA
ncbi:helix-turn-helix domain-containing protein [Varunaivibrio sulfuroxidans]|uniref:Putative transcriptional regulator n=1 Tax=Varunaivibrio sulfuroxidans TaxID=1773489 RepID=A0A4R3J3R3_9PROT|nr:helix-turn-helix domain-containing protein [Varunaivibrio sulfuroxidans]TCS59957.1 putative transcriptional regulator [Varunaivibrio sulfuroxidans]WES31759.1 helix-turn-helix domain-containing protein [Varunaivibrio sulfuroxidans]